MVGYPTKGDHSKYTNQSCYWYFPTSQQIAKVIRSGIITNSVVHISQGPGFSIRGPLWRLFGLFELLPQQLVVTDVDASTKPLPRVEPAPMQRTRCHLQLPCLSLNRISVKWVGFSFSPLPRPMHLFPSGSSGRPDQSPLASPGEPKVTTSSIPGRQHFCRLAGCAYHQSLGSTEQTNVRCSAIGST